MSDGKSFNSISGETMRSWAMRNPDDMTLTDFYCQTCGKVHRRYLMLREVPLLKKCECGGILKSPMDAEILSIITRKTA